MRIESINPADGSVNATIEPISASQAVEVCRNAHEAFADWKNRSLSERGAYLKKLAQALRAKKRTYAETMVKEMGKPIAQAESEVEKSAWTADVYAENASEWLKDHEVKADGQKHVVRFEPLGTVLCIMPWNFPFWQVLRVAIPTLIAGNTVVLRHSNNVPLCAQALEAAFQDAAFPKDVFSVVVTEHDAAKAMIESRYIQGVSLTGSEKAGQIVGAQASANLKKLVLELGGSDAFIVLEDASLEKAVAAAVQGRTQNNGQSCIAAKRFIVHEKIADSFTKKFAEKIASLKVGDPMDPKTQIGPLSSFKQRDEVKSQVDDSVAKGAKILCGGNIPHGMEKGAFYAPTVLSEVTKQMRVWSEEVFGPAAPVMVVFSDEEAIALANDSELGLGGSVWTEDRERGEAVAKKIESGAVFVNHVTKSDPRMPFGGIKKSGIGRELGEFGLKEFCNVKAYNIY